MGSQSLGGGESLRTGISLKGRIQQLEMECAAAQAAAKQLEKTMVKNSVIDRKAGRIEGARRYAAKPVTEENASWTSSLLVDKSGRVTELSGTPCSSAAMVCVPALWDE